MRTDLLIKVCELLIALPKDRFHYGHWVGQGWEGRENLSCGTTACALGWATQIPECRDLGLTFDRLGITPKDRHPMLAHVLRIASEVFQISGSDAIYLFLPDAHHRDNRVHDALGYSPGSHCPAIEVARHIRKFVEYRMAHPEEDIPYHAFAR